MFVSSVGHFSGEPIYAVEIEITQCGFQAPEQWLRDNGWKSSSFHEGYDYQFLGSRADMGATTNAWSLEFYKYAFKDPKKARLFLLVWDGKRI